MKLLISSLHKNFYNMQIHWNTYHNGCTSKCTTITKCILCHMRQEKNTKISKMKTNKILIYMEYLTVSVNCLVFLGLPYRKPMPQSMTTNTWFGVEKHAIQVINKIQLSTNRSINAVYELVEKIYQITESLVHIMS